MLGKLIKEKKEFEYNKDEFLLFTRQFLTAILLMLFFDIVLMGFSKLYSLYGALYLLFAMKIFGFLGFAYVFKIVEKKAKVNEKFMERMKNEVN